MTKLNCNKKLKWNERKAATQNSSNPITVGRFFFIINFTLVQFHCFLVSIPSSQNCSGNACKLWSEHTEHSVHERLSFSIHFFISSLRLFSSSVSLISCVAAVVHRRSGKSVENEEEEIRKKANKTVFAYLCVICCTRKRI